MTRILVADDEPSIRLTVATLLRLEGYVVDSAADGIEALSLANLNPPDLLICDLQMPHMGGLALLQAVYDSPQLRHARSLVLAGWDDSDTQAQMARNLAHRCIKKPFTRAQILEALQGLGIGP